jgi:hypothetical protein
LQNTIVALRPILPNVPFDLPNSVRALDPTMPLGTVLDTMAFSPAGDPITVVNHEVNFGWEYVWHCHILAHEENDMMRTMAFAVTPPAPSGLSITMIKKSVVLTWMDNSLGETGFLIERANDLGFTIGLTSFQVGKDVTTFTDGTGLSNKLSYFYRVKAINTVGDTWDYAAAAGNPGATNFPTLTVSSSWSNIVGAPSGTTTLLTLTQGALQGDPVVATWSYVPGGDQTGFEVQRATNAAFTQGLQRFRVGGTVLSYSDTSTKAGILYYYRVVPTNAFGMGAWSNTLSITPHK